jgi:hypothetical protein
VDVSTAVLEREAYTDLGKKAPESGKAMYGFAKRAAWGEG